MTASRTRVFTGRNEELLAVILCHYHRTDINTLCVITIINTNITRNLTVYYLIATSP